VFVVVVAVTVVVVPVTVVVVSVTVVVAVTVVVMQESHRAGHVTLVYAFVIELSQYDFGTLHSGRGSGRPLQNPVVVDVDVVDDVSLQELHRLGQDPRTRWPIFAFAQIVSWPTNAAQDFLSRFPLHVGIVVVVVVSV